MIVNDLVVEGENIDGHVDDVTHIDENVANSDPNDIAIL